MKHRLDPLLRPRSVAVVGASQRADSMGEWALRNLEIGGFGGKIYPVNPSYEEIDGRKCYANLADLPQSPDLAIFAVGDLRIEAALDDAIEKSIPAAVIMSSLYIDGDSAPPLKERVQKKIADAGMLLCGANGMGFYNVRDHVWACGFDTAPHAAPGKISFISHSGSGMCGIIDCDERVLINFAVSTGNELSVSMDEYLDFVLDLPETKVVGLFVETARNPQGFRAALQKANDRNIPVVALKVGRTKKSAELTVSHSGAMAGDDDTYDALFRHYGVHRVRDMDELATALIVFSEMYPIGPGGLVTLHDSGGERQLLIDLADDAGVPLTELNEATVSALDELLDPELPRVNPLDAWSRGGEGAGERIDDCFAAMLADPGAALGAVIHDRAPYGLVYEAYVRRMKRARRACDKPIALVAARQGTGSDPQVVDVTLEGLPVLDGVTQFLQAVRGLMDYRDFRARPDMSLPAVPQAVVKKWSARLSENRELREAEALAMLADFGIDTSNPQCIGSSAELSEAASRIVFPCVLKTAENIRHKTEVAGVHLSIGSENELDAAYEDLSGRLGPRAVLSSMISPGVEMLLGMKYDEQFGPVVILGFGGVQAETLRDITFVMPPFDAACAGRLLDNLRLRAMLDGVRGSAAADIAAFADAAAKFSVMVDALRDQVAELDVNPVIVGEKGCVAVDALLVCRSKSSTGTEE